MKLMSSEFVAEGFSICELKFRFVNSDLFSTPLLDLVLSSSRGIARDDKRWKACGSN